MLQERKFEPGKWLSALGYCWIDIHLINKIVETWFIMFSIVKFDFDDQRYNIWKHTPIGGMIRFAVWSKKAYLAAL